MHRAVKNIFFYLDRINYEKNYQDKKLIIDPLFYN